ncbi:MAG TPA: hypothetical protein VM370_02295 [Candidatus Thermoplasmatota archaeon]|nr:hypothetical protein [Candidatus Thermoplasmatota archaeon]
MPAPSLFCEHKRLRSVCPACGAARAGGATPMRAAVAHEVDDTIHAFRLQCHAKARDHLTRVAAGEAPARAYAAAYDEMERRGKVHSEEEDPATFRGGFYRSMVKMFDVAIDGRRIQGYNGLADWDEMRDFVFRKLSPAELDEALRAKRLLIHGGNAAWPRQQIASELLRSDAIEEAVLGVVRAASGSDAEVARALDAAEALAVAAGGKPGATPLFSKVLHVMDAARWPALTPRATPEVGEELGAPIPPVEKPSDYLAFAAAMRALAKAKGHSDLERTDMLVADTWEMLHPDV